MTAADIVAALPAHVALGHGADHITSTDVRDRLQAIGQHDPKRGHGIADQLMACALQLIADGHPNPAAIAADALTVCSADFERWYA